MILCRPDGTTTLLEAANGPVLGLAEQPRRSARVPFPPGSTLLAYTDGLIERRDEGIDDGIDRIRLVLAEPQGLGDVEALADTLLATAGASAALADDIALIAVHRPANGEPSPGAVSI